jgi:NitT/TauT family transport system substrate-binding protein
MTGWMLAASRVLLVFLASLAAVCSVRAENIVRLGHNRTWSNTALILGLADDDFSSFGIKVAEHEFTNPADIVTAIAGGDLDVGTVPAATVLTAVSHGVRVKAVSVVQGRNNPPIAYTVRTDSGINSVADLRGKIAGINNYGGTYDIYLRYWLTRAGLDPNKDIKIIIVPVPAMVPSLINRQIDIVPIASFDQVLLAKNYAGQTRTLFTYDDVLMAGIGTHDNNGLVLVMADGFIAKHRDVAVRFMAGYLRAVRRTNAAPKAAVREWAQVVKNPMLVKLTAPPVVPDDGRIYMKALQFDADLAYRFGYLKSPIDVRQMVDESIVDAAQVLLR